MITVWTKCPQSTTFTNLAPVLRTVPDLPVTVVNDFTVPQGTTTLLALGKESLQKLQDEKLVAKNRSTTSLRTLPQMRNAVPVLVSYSPDICYADHRYYVDLLTDVTLAVRHELTGTWKPVYGQYEYVEDFTPLIAGIEAQHKETGKPVDVMKDLETVGLDPYAEPMIAPPFPGAYIVTMQATHQKGRAWVVRFCNRLHEEERLHDPAFREQVEFLLTCDWIRLKGANFKFDLHWLWKRGQFRCKNFSMDTTIVGSLLDENRSNALDVHVKIYVPRLAGYSDEFDRTIDKNRMDLVPPPTLIPYAGGDVDGGLELAEVEKKELLRDPALTSFYVNILHPAARAFEDIEQGGMFVDMEAYQALKVELEAAHVENVKKACKIMGGRIVAKHGDLTKPGGMNLTKASMLCDFMFSPMGLNLKPKMFTAKPDKDGNPRPATSKEHLQMFADVDGASEFIKIIEEDGSVMKMLSTYVVGFLECLRSDGKFHPTFFLFAGNKDEDEGGTNTGRLSATDPAVQTIPKHNVWAKKIRRCFPAPPGYVVVERDYSQGELRVIACIANETNMIAAYKANLDLHVKTSAKFAGYTYESLKALKKTDEHTYRETRQLGKAGNFGLLYAMQVNGFLVYAKRNYGVTLTYEEGEKFRNGFFDDYPALLTYHEKQKADAKKFGQVRSPLGRVRHLPLINSPNKEERSKAERQAINSPVQGCLSDMLLWSLAEEHKAGLHSIAPCFGTCHDAAYNYVPEDQVDTVVRKMLEIQENLPFQKVGWNPQLKFPADASVGKTMGDLEEFQR